MRALTRLTLLRWDSRTGFRSGARSPRIFSRPISQPFDRMTEKILFVDDDVQLLEGLQRSLRRQFNVETAVGGAEGLNKIAAAGPFALIVADMQMPGMSGLEFLR